MKRLIWGMLLAATGLSSAPAAAQVAERRYDEDRPVRADRPRATPEERAERREARAERRAEAAPDAPRPERADRPDRETRRERRMDGDGIRAARPDRVVERPAAQVFPPPRDIGREERREARRDARDDRRGDRRDDRREALGDRRNDRFGRATIDRAREAYRFDRRNDRNDGAGLDRRADRDGRYGFDRRERQEDWGRDAYRGGQVWNRGWRADRRYDWTRYRQSDPGLYRLPRYYAPQGFGYGYRRFGLGATLQRSLFGPSYWIDDPYGYRLPPAYGPYRWVRYHGDALLVDLRTGRVVDVVHDIFY